MPKVGVTPGSSTAPHRRRPRRPGPGPAAAPARDAPHQGGPGMALVLKAPFLGRLKTQPCGGVRSAAVCEVLFGVMLPGDQVRAGPLACLAHRAWAVPG